MDKEAIWQKTVRLFNEQAYWECHETLEPLWLKAKEPEKSFFGGVILLAAALHKARVMKSARGGRRNYAKALKHLALFPDSFYQTDIRELEHRVHYALRYPDFCPVFPLVQDLDS